jgi:hypothetical protein
MVTQLVADAMVTRLREWARLACSNTPGMASTHCWARFSALAHRNSSRRATRRWPPSWPADTRSTAVSSVCACPLRAPGAIHAGRSVRREAGSPPRGRNRRAGDVHGARQRLLAGGRPGYSVQRRLQSVRTNRVRAGAGADGPRQRDARGAGHVDADVSDRPA